MSGIRLAEPIVDRIRGHAAATYPYECCGALIGTSAGGVDVVEALPLENVTEEGPRRRFLVSPREYQQAEARARASGAELVGFYHSHPDHPAQPSQYDLDHAWPNLSYVIVSVKAGQTEDLRSWRLRPDRSAFDEEATIFSTSNSQLHNAPR